MTVSQARFVRSGFPQCDPTPRGLSGRSPRPSGSPRPLTTDANRALGTLRLIAPNQCSQRHDTHWTGVSDNPPIKGSASLTLHLPRHESRPVLRLAGGRHIIRHIREAFRAMSTAKVFLSLRLADTAKFVGDAPFGFGDPRVR